MKEIFESLLNRVLSHGKDKDMAMMTAFRPERLESELNRLGYRGYVRAAGYWDEDSDDPAGADTEAARETDWETEAIRETKAAREEVFLILNTGNTNFEEFREDMTGLQRLYKQPRLLIRDHTCGKAYVSVTGGGTVHTGEYGLASLTADTLSVAWAETKCHSTGPFRFAECYPNDRFSVRFNEGGNFMTAMMYDANRRRLRKISGTLPLSP